MNEMIQSVDGEEVLSYELILRRSKRPKNDHEKGNGIQAKRVEHDEKKDYVEMTFLDFGWTIYHAPGGYSGIYDKKAIDDY
jgi:hypothetical protein